MESPQYPVTNAVCLNQIIIHTGVSHRLSENTPKSEVSQSSCWFSVLWFLNATKCNLSHFVLFICSVINPVLIPGMVPITTLD